MGRDPPDDADEKGPSPAFVSRGGLKLDHGLRTFGVHPTGRACADLGCSTGGFVDCLLRAGAAKVYAVDRGYGVLDYSLRNDDRVVVMERTDALHVRLPEPPSLVTIDVGWTQQHRILPAALRQLATGGEIITLVKPHYEAPRALLDGGVVPDQHLPGVLDGVRPVLDSLGLVLRGETESPIRGGGGNREWLWHLRRT